MSIDLTILPTHTDKDGVCEIGLYWIVPGIKSNALIEWSSADSPDGKPAEDQVIESIVGMLKSAPYSITEAVLNAMMVPLPEPLAREVAGKPIDLRFMCWDEQTDGFIGGPDNAKLGHLVYAVGIVHWGTVDGRSGSMPTKAEAKAYLETAIKEKWPLEEYTNPIKPTVVVYDQNKAVV